MSAALGFGLLGLAALVAPVPWRRGAGGQSRPVGTPERRAAAVPLLAGAAAAGRRGEVAVVVVRSAARGLKLASGLEGLAADIRAERAAAAAARAHRAGVVAMAPLAACFLPSFVCLGIVPVLVGVARSALTVLH